MEVVLLKTVAVILGVCGVILTFAGIRQVGIFPVVPLFLGGYWTLNRKAENIKKEQQKK